MTQEYAVKITPDGAVFFMYSDDHDLFTMEELETIEVHRASDVRFDNEISRWVIYAKQPDGSEKRLEGTYHKRADAIRAEIDFLEQRLGDPEYVESFFAPKK